MPEVFLTGGTGFIGGALLRRLVGEGREVRALVRTVAAADAI
ncbi:MAG: NAD-dependent epimerase/dehydratase family protein, partial [Acidimicrobiia bacterium]